MITKIYNIVASFLLFAFFQLKENKIENTSEQFKHDFKFILIFTKINIFIQIIFAVL